MERMATEVEVAAARQLSGLQISLFIVQVSRLAKKLPVGDLKTMAAEVEVAAAERSRSVGVLQQGADDDELDLS